MPGKTSRKSAKDAKKTAAALIHEVVDPEVVEEWKWMGSPVWPHEGMYAHSRNAHRMVD